MGIRELGRRLFLRSAGGGVPSAADVDPYVVGLAKRVRRLEIALFEMSPAEIPITPAIERSIGHFREAFAFEGPFELAISKRDTMYLFLHDLREDSALAYWEYLQTGLAAARTYEDVVHKRFGGFDGLRGLLDFASGYGRVTRFLVRSVAPDRLWVTDIKEQAVAFQREKLGVQGFATTSDPADFPEAVRFDAIFAASFFSHLPEDRFAGWLRTLYARLLEGGVLAISVNDASHEDPPPRRLAPFAFRTYSEDSLFPYLDDGLSDGTAYGTTYVTEDYLRGLLAELGCRDDQVVRRPRGLWQVQDLYLIGRGDGPLA